MTDNLLNLIDCEDVLLTDCCYLDLSDLTQFSRFNDFVVAHLNIHSLPNKYDDFVEMLNILSDKNLLPDIIGLCETFLSEKNYSKYSFDGFDIISQYRKCKKQGGVSIMVKSHINFIERLDLSLFEEGKFESIFIEIPRKGKCNVIVGEIYRVPGTSEIEFLEMYERVIKDIRSEHKQIIIATDQNLDYLKINVHCNTMKFFEMNLSNNIIPTVYKPTRVTFNSATLIDNIYVDCELHSDAKSFIIKTDISDHYMCLTIIQDELCKANYKKNVKIRRLTDSVLRNMNASLANRHWQILNNMTVDAGSEFLTNEINTVMDFYAPEKTIKYDMSKCKLKAEWFSQGLMVSSRKCLQLYKKVAAKSRDDPEFLNYKRYRNIYNSLRRKAKFSYYNEIVTRNKNDAKKLWQVLNKLTGKLINKKDISDEILVNGIKTNDQKVIANAFADYYSTVGKSLAEHIEKKGNLKDPMIYMKNRVQQNCFLFPTDKVEIEKIVKKLKVKDSKGYDWISNRILKKIYIGIADALVIIFNKSLQEGIFPSNMKLSIVKPLYKGKDKTEIVNYRPICLLPVISKILEKIVNNRIVKFLIKNKVLYEGQYGFRSNRSTTDAILDFTGNILDSLNKGQYVLSLFLDMSKAFDSISHHTLYKKLEFYGIRGNVLLWFKSYLSDRFIKVKVNNTLSEKYLMTYGTPQGSVLGPLMYLILANDLVKTLKFSNCVTFADDTTIFASGSNLKFLYHKVNEDLKLVTDWFDSNSLTLNAEKTKYILFRSKRKEVNYNGVIRLGRSVITRVTDIKFLGVKIDEYLEWENQVKHILTRMIAGNYSLSMVKNMLPVKSKLLIYHSNVSSHLNYALSTWGPMLKERDIKKIQIQQNKSIRQIFNLKKRERLSQFYKSGNILKVEHLTELALVKISYRYMNDLLSKRIVNLFELGNHDYHTRNRNNLRAIRHTAHSYNKSFLGRAPGLWLNLSATLKTAKNIKIFSKLFMKEKTQTY